MVYQEKLLDLLQEVDPCLCMDAGYANPFTLLHYPNEGLGLRLKLSALLDLPKNSGFDAKQGSFYSVKRNALAMKQIWDKNFPEYRLILAWWSGSDILIVGWAGLTSLDMEPWLSWQLPEFPLTEDALIAEGLADVEDWQDVDGLDDVFVRFPLAVETPVETEDDEPVETSIWFAPEAEDVVWPEALSGTIELFIPSEVPYAPEPEPYVTEPTPSWEPASSPSWEPASSPSWEPASSPSWEPEPAADYSAPDTSSSSWD